MKDDLNIYYQFLLPHLYISLWKVAGSELLKFLIVQEMFH